MPASVPVVRTRRAGITRVPAPLTEPPALCAFAGQATVGNRKAPYDEAEHNADGRNVQDGLKTHRDSLGRLTDRASAAGEPRAGARVVDAVLRPPGPSTPLPLRR